MKRLLEKALLLALLIMPCGICAQTDVNRKKYPDYTDAVNPDWSLVQKSENSGAQRALSTQLATRPDHVNNADTKYFPPVFNQDGGSCGSASRICYMFTHELNAYRDLDGKQPENYYPSHFVWLLTNGNSNKDQFVTNIGVPSAATYGGQTYSQYFGNQDTEDSDFGWMQGYDKWFEAMHNRMLPPVNFPLHVGTEEGREAVKNWLWNHNGDYDFKAGGICGIGVASYGDYDGKIPSTAANEAAGVAGLKYLRAWGTQVDHALTIVGYDDRVEFDLDGDGVVGEADADEKGAWIIVNSWGPWWQNNGFIYCPYAYGGATFNSSGKFSGNWWTPEVYKVRKNYRPLRTIKIEMEYSRRSEMCLSAGVSADLNAEMPDKSVTFDHFKYAGDGNNGNSNPAPEVPMLGRWADGKLHTEPMEFGYDLTDLSEGYDKSMPLKYFFIVETRSWAAGEGKIHKASIIDHEHNTDGVETPFDIPAGAVSIKNAGEKTIISVIVHGEPFYAPRNVSLTTNGILWEAPYDGGKKVEAYRIYCGNTLVAEVAADTRSHNIEIDGGTYAVSAVYEGGAESHKCSTTAPVPVEEENVAVSLEKSGFRIPHIFDTKYDKATIEFRINPYELLSYNQNVGPGWGQFLLHSDWGGPVVVGWDTNNRITTAYNCLRTNVWSHVAIVVDGNNMKVYINGVQKGEVTSQTYSGIGGFGDLVFNANVGSYDYSYMNAAIDELRIWNRARTATEITQCKDAQFAGSVMPDGLVAYYKGEITTIDGEPALKESISGNHAPILNSNYKAQTLGGKPGASSAGTSVSIDSPAEDVVAGVPVTLTATYSDAVAKLAWSVEGCNIDAMPIKAPTVVFPTAGEYRVTVTAEDFNGTVTTDELQLTVIGESTPDATFRVGSHLAIKGEKVLFVPENPVIGCKYKWEMPGATVEEIEGLHASAVYATSGQKQVTLTVTSPAGTKSSSHTVEFEVLESLPTAQFEVSPAIIIKGERTLLKDISKFNPSEWLWTVENETKKYIINGQHSTLAPTVPGIYDVTLQVVNDAGRSSTTQERALIVCNADSKNGLSFAGRSNAKVETTLTGLTLPAYELTIEWWMRPDELAEACLGMGDYSSTLLLTANTDGRILMDVGGYTGKSGTGYVIPNEWHHYTAMLCDGYADFYRDGEYFSTSYISYSAHIPSLYKFIIGNDNAPMNGQIDELRVWNKALTTEEIAAVCNAPIENPQQQSGLLLYYDFNQSGGDVIDRSGNGNNGVRSGFGPDGDAWGLSKGVFCINTDKSTDKEITKEYLKNYKREFSNNGTVVNSTIANRFYAITGWTIKNSEYDGSITTGAHVDKNKSSCMTITTGWDKFSYSLTNHKVYQTVELPAGNYIFTAHYNSTWEGQCGNSYVVAAEGAGLPNTTKLESGSIAHTTMVAKGTTMANSISFTLKAPTTVSLGLLVNMEGNKCLNIDHFTLERDNTEYLEADGGTTSIGSTTAGTTTTDNCIYDLQGRKITSPAKGHIYIKDGKKFINR